MRGLNQLTLINSASLNYANIKLNGNTLLSGANGVGKTTILRAILFFYHANVRKVDINSAKKRSFREYYFDSLNSYLIYKYSNNFGNSYVVMYKTSNDIRYRFFHSLSELDIKDIFFKDNIALDIASVITNLRAKDVTISNTIQSAKEYRDILYDHDRANKQFALFNTNKEYAQIHNTISNIFINSKLDSNVIKKSLVNTVDDFTPIDLNQIRANISQFLDEIKDIKAYESSKEYINQSLKYLVSYYSSKEMLKDKAKEFFAQINYSLANIEDIKNQQDENSKELELKTKEQELLKSSFDKQLKSLTKKEIILSEFIKNAKQKQKYYQDINIDDKISFYNTKDMIKSSFDSLKDEIYLLKSKASGEAFKYDELIQKQQNQYEQFKNDKQKESNSKFQKHLEQINELQKNKTKEIKKLHDFYDTQIDEHNRVVVDIKDKVKDEKYSYKTIENKEFLKDDISNISTTIDKNTAMQHNLNLELEQSKSAMSKLDSEVEKSEQTTQNEIDKLGSKSQVQKDKISQTIKDIEQKLNISTDTFLGFLKESNFKYTTLLSAILKDDVLFSKDLNPTIKNDSANIYGIDIDSSSLDISLYNQGSLEQQLQEQLKSIDDLKIEFEQKKKSLEKDNEKNIKAFYSQKKTLNEKINTIQIELSKLDSTIKKDTITKEQLITDAQNLKTKELEGIKEKISNLEDRLSIENEKYLKLKTQLNSKIKAVKTNITKDENRLKEEYELFKKDTDLTIVEFEKSIKKNIDELSLQKRDILSKKGIDTSSLSIKEDELKKLEQSLKEIEDLTVTINDYQKDTKEYMSLLPSKNVELKSVLKDIEQIEFIYEKELQNILNSIESLSAKKELLKDEFNKFDQNIKEFKSIEELPIYSQIVQYKDDKIAIKYENISFIKDKLYGLMEDIKLSIKKLSKALNFVFKNISSNNILNIQPPFSSDDEDILSCANILKEFEQQNKIKTFQQELSSRYALSLNHYEKEIRNLLYAQGTIQKTINKISKKLQDLKNIKVIQKVELRYNHTQDRAVQLLVELKNLYENNAFVSDINLFNPLGANDEFNQKVIDIFEKLNEYLYEYSKKEFITLEDSFVLEFRAIENGNDTGFVSVLDDVGSNGTDVMIKVMVYIAMLNLALEQSLNKKGDENLYLHCILDEVGILSPKYLKELIHYANEQNIRFVNGAPDEKIVTTYKRVYMLRTTNEHKTIVNEIISHI